VRDCFRHEDGLNGFSEAIEAVDQLALAILPVCRAAILTERAFQARTAWGMSVHYQARGDGSGKCQDNRERNYSDRTFD